MVLHQGTSLCDRSIPLFIFLNYLIAGKPILRRECCTANSQQQR
ncbi:MAG TPA: hypothetical protein V6D28_03180 [Leptolyngbyaceae cyanobacterium]